MVNIYIAYVINFPAYAQQADLILGMSSFGTVKLTKSPDCGLWHIYIYIYIYIYILYMYNIQYI